MSSRTVSSVVSCLPTITRSARASIRDAEFRFSQTSGGFGERLADLDTDDRRHADRKLLRNAGRGKLRFAPFRKACRLLTSPNRPNRGQDHRHVNRHQERFLPQLAVPVAALKGAKSLVRRDVRSARRLVLPNLEIQTHMGRILALSGGKTDSPKDAI